MRDYSTIPVTRHKWENWDCCPEHLRIDLNHKITTEPRSHDNGNATRDLADRYGLNTMETKAAFILAGISGLAWQKIRSSDHDLVISAMVKYKAMIPANCMTLPAYAKAFHRSHTWIFLLTKEREIQPIAKLVDMSYYAIEDIHSLYKEKP